MHRLIITGCGTDVGKTVVTAVLATLLQADTWKPIECGDHPDTEVMRGLIPAERVHPSAYRLKAPLSPHHAARLEGIQIGPLTLPVTQRPLIIETAGGALVPLTTHQLFIDQAAHWDASWVVVSRHYLGSINHTLLTLEALQQRRLPVLGVVFNGEPNPDSEEAILTLSGSRCLGRIRPQPQIDRATIQRIAEQWDSPKHVMPCSCDAQGREIRAGRPTPEAASLREERHSVAPLCNASGNTEPASCRSLRSPAYGQVSSLRHSQPCSLSEKGRGPTPNTVDYWGPARNAKASDGDCRPSASRNTSITC
jgi:dethiobiotin synthetase